LITDLLREEIADLNEAAIFSAGPHGLLEETARIAASAKIAAQVSLERYMACGMGVCLGCAVKLRDQTYVRACREGPVFDAESIMWTES
jgi:dihydroorotate dehydrogenase electron transfer subunit